jgi:hypothetical protein
VKFQLIEQDESRLSGSRGAKTTVLNNSPSGGGGKTSKREFLQEEEITKSPPK